MHLDSHRLRRLSLELLEARQLMAADMVLHWNEVLLAAVRADRTPPPIASRAMAIVHARFTTRSTPLSERTRCMRSMKGGDHPPRRRWSAAPGSW